METEGEKILIKKRSNLSVPLLFIVSPLTNFYQPEYLCTVIEEIPVLTFI